MALLIPIGRSDDVTLGDPRIVENVGQPVEQGFPAPESPASAFLRFLLTDAGRRDGSRQGEETTRLHIEPITLLPQSGSTGFMSIEP